MTAPSETLPTVLPARLRTGGLSLRLIRSHGKLSAGIALVAVIALLALLSHIIAPDNPNNQDLTQQFLRPSPAHIMGTDQFGRDVFSRVLYAAGLDLQIAFFGTIFCLAVGLTIGLVAGYFGGLVDLAAGRLIDFIIAFPGIVAIIAIIAVLGNSIPHLYLALTITGWTAYARIVRGEVISAKHLPYVVAARSLGYSHTRILVRHIIPNVVTPALLFWITDMVGTVLLITALSYLGLGPQPPIPEWGAMIAEARPFILLAWWVPLFPGIAIVVTGFSLGLLGDGLADALRAEQ